MEYRGNHTNDPFVEPYVVGNQVHIATQEWFNTNPWDHKKHGSTILFIFHFNGQKHKPDLIEERSKQSATVNRSSLIYLSKKTHGMVNGCARALSLCFRYICASFEVSVKQCVSQVLHEKYKLLEIFKAVRLAVLEMLSIFVICANDTA